MAKIGVQAMMLKGAVEEHGAYEALRRVREIGYGAIEVSQIPMTTENVTELARAKDELGVEMAAISATVGPQVVGNDSLSERFDKIVADARALDSTMIRIGMLPLASLASLDQVLEFCDEAERMAVRLRDEGIELHYHNHHVEFVKIDGTHLLDIIADRSPTVGLELDVHWLQRGGLDPQRAIAARAGRVSMVHLKDYRIGHMPESVFEALSKGDRSAVYDAFNAVVQFGEVGEGNLDWHGIIPTAVDAGARYLLVEQDLLYGRDVFDCLQTSYDNLQSMGFGELF